MKMTRLPWDRYRYLDIMQYSMNKRRQDTRPSHRFNGGTADDTEQLCIDRVLRACKTKANSTFMQYSMSHIIIVRLYY